MKIDEILSETEENKTTELFKKLAVDINQVNKFIENWRECQNDGMRELKKSGKNLGLK
jgi:hypothetical protein